MSGDVRNEAVEGPMTKRVLVVDEDRVARRMLDDILTAAGFAVVTAPGAEEALAVLGASHMFTAVIANDTISGRTSIELLQQIRTTRDDDLAIVFLGNTPPAGLSAVVAGDAQVRYVGRAETQSRLAAVLKDLIDVTPAPLPLPKSESRLRNATQVQTADPVAFEAALGQLWIAFQPIVSWKQRSLFGFEALVRSSSEALPNPGLLFQAAEDLGRVWELGRCIRRLIAHNIPAAPSESRIFVNLHAADLNDEDLYLPESALAVHARRVVLEVTERASLDRVRDVKERLRALRKLGFSIAVDDLGAGYAGLASFGLLEPEVVKLDMSLIRDIDAHPRIQRVVQFMLSACSEDMDVVCEGVETAAERDTLLDLGADLLQGYLIGRPAAGFNRPLL